MGNNQNTKIAQKSISNINTDKGKKGDWILTMIDVCIEPKKKKQSEVCKKSQFVYPFYMYIEENTQTKHKTSKNKYSK